MDTEKRLFLAFALSMMVILAFSWLNAKNHPVPSDSSDSTAMSDSVSPGGATDTVRSATPSGLQDAGAPESIERASEAATAWNLLTAARTESATGETVVESPLYRIRFSSLGGMPSSWQLLKFPELYAEERYLKLAEDNGPEVRREIATLELQMVERAREQGENPPVNAINPFYRQGRAGLMIRWGDRLWDSGLTYQSNTSHLEVKEEGETELVFTADAGGAVIEKRYRFYPDEYKVDLQVSVINRSGSDMTFDRAGYYDVWWQGGFGFTSLRLDAENSLHLSLGGGVTTLPRKSLMGEIALDPTGRMAFGEGQLKDYYSPAKAVRKNDETVGWVSVGQKYFMSAIVPHTPTQIALEGVTSPDVATLNFVKPAAGVRMSMETLPGGAAHTDRFTLYVGPLDEKAMAPVQAGLEEARPMFLRSFTGPIERWMLGLLNGLYSLAPNYGVCIILLTVLIKLLMFPVYQKQIKSMRKMQKLQPQINALKEQYKDDPQKQQKEQLELFRKHKVNPLGGCLPIFITIPIFIALYATFSMSVELRGAPFFGWINDLSQPDAAFYLPLGGWIIDVNILPIAYAILMFISMTLQSVDNSPNAQAMRIMPMIFVFFFWSIASGVILYFVVSMSIDVTQRLIIEKLHKDDMPAPPEPPANKKARAPAR